MQLRLKLMRFSMLVRLAIESGLSQESRSKTRQRGDWKRGVAADRSHYAVPASLGAKLD
jgi:hypothetical protein